MSASQNRFLFLPPHKMDSKSVSKFFESMNPFGSSSSGSGFKGKKHVLGTKADEAERKKVKEEEARRRQEAAEAQAAAAAGSRAPASTSRQGQAAGLGAAPPRRPPAGYVTRQKNPLTTTRPNRSFFVVLRGVEMLGTLQKPEREP